MTAEERPTQHVQCGRRFGLARHAGLRQLEQQAGVIFPFRFNRSVQGSAVTRTGGLIEFDAFVMYRHNPRRPAPSH
jgi:hypothetical protein